jgi:DNA invertase Pin-like site-specific DNA recombinase
LSRIGYARVSTNDQDTASGRVVLEGVPTPEAAEDLAEQVHRRRLQHGYQRVW